MYVHTQRCHCAGLKLCSPTINNAARVLSALLENDLNLCCAAHVITQMQKKPEPCAFCASDYRLWCAGGGIQHFALSLAFYFLGRTHLILAEHNEVQIVSEASATSFFVAGERAQILELRARNEKRYNLGAENKKICHWLQRERWFHPSKVLRWESTCVYSKSRIQGPWPLRARTKSPNVMSSQRSRTHIQITQDNLRRSDFGAAAGFAVEFGSAVLATKKFSSSDMQARVNNYSRAALGLEKWYRNKISK